MKRPKRKCLEKIYRVKPPFKLKPCPFCGSKELAFYYQITGEDLFHNSFYYKSRGRTIDSSCENCGMGFQFGWFGRGIKLKEALKYASERWNQRHEQGR